jgi:predicted Zn-dependent peptidase
VRSLKTVSGKANRIGFAEVVFGDYRALSRVEPEWEAVTAEDVRRVVGAYLAPERKTVVTLDPVRPGGGKP